MTQKTERENIQLVQKHLAGAKRIAREERARQDELGDVAASNAWYKFEGKLMVLHGEATEDLLAHFPEHSETIAPGTKSGGGR